MSDTVHRVNFLHAGRGRVILYEGRTKACTKASLWFERDYPDLS